MLVGRKTLSKAADMIEVPCWHQLFNIQVIVQDFPIPERTQGKGLEISFPKMAARFYWKLKNAVRHHAIVYDNDAQIGW
jgi:hypothetical protein